jgi:transposase
MPPNMMSIRKEALMGAKKEYQKLDREFIESAVKLVESGKSAAQVARELGLQPWRVQNWVRDSKKKTTKGTGFDAIVEENKRLRRELARAQEEAEILKKASAYFARHQK